MLDRRSIGRFLAAQQFRCGCLLSISDSAYDADRHAQRLFEANKVEGAPIALAEYWLTKIGTDFRYQKGVTTTVTAAHEAWELGAGVCQDFAHILLAFLRAQNVICRYVAGLTTGEGASHAWVEVLTVKHGSEWILRIRDSVTIITSRFHKDQTLVLRFRKRRLYGRSGSKYVGKV